MEERRSRRLPTPHVGASFELLRGGKLTAGEIATHFDMTKPSLGHHQNYSRQQAWSRHTEMAKSSTASTRRYCRI